LATHADAILCHDLVADETDQPGSLFTRVS
jgi:hypothetical protein